jgi:hypothetical protein
MNIDIELLKKQKEYLISMIAEGDLGLPEECELLEGLVHMLDAIQDDYEEKMLEELIQGDIDKCKRDPHYLAAIVEWCYQDWTPEMIEQEVNLRRN